tara:strand:- start:3038 stop:3475 length:438 start_codon:yes stop_codon:yes gene_type:complete
MKNLISLFILIGMIIAANASQDDISSDRCELLSGNIDGLISQSFHYEDIIGKTIETYFEDLGFYFTYDFREDGVLIYSDNAPQIIESSWWIDEIDKKIRVNIIRTDVMNIDFNSCKIFSKLPECNSWAVLDVVKIDGLPCLSNDN